jgi:iron complex outermembrane recepter protein
MKYSIRDARFASLLISCTAMTVPTFAIAQEAGSAPTEDSADQGMAGEIIVTATKHNESLQRVPISVSAFTGEQVERLGITDTTQITQQIPSLRVNAWSPNLTIFSLRGISQSNFTDNLEAPVAGDAQQPRSRLQDFAVRSHAPAERHPLSLCV